MSYRPDKKPFPGPIRDQILAEEPVCRACLRRPATEADHVVPTAFGGSNDRANGQGLCATCHAHKTRLETAEGQRRRAARARIAPEPHPGMLE